MDEVHLVWFGLIGFIVFIAILVVALSSLSVGRRR
jgi:DMSO/TMAO reductase YedYZ heme-binding membrane subunit